MDGAAFAAALEENLDMTGIAYIQPDFALETFETKTIELTVDGDAGETEISSQTAEPAQSPEPEEPVGPPVPETTPEIEQTLAPEATQEPETTPEATSGQTQENAQPPLVALLDSWVDTQHEGLSGYLAQGACIAEGAEDADLTHGTHVAGIIAQNAPNALVLPLGVFVNGRAYTSDIVRAIWAAKDAGALVVNCSWGSSDNNQMLYDAMAQSGLLFVCAAGNNRAGFRQGPGVPGGV